MDTRREVELARHPRRRSTPAEREAWGMLRDRRCQGLKVKPPHLLGDFIVDFYCPALKLVVELDGAIHDDPDHAAYDAIRTAELEASGMVVRRLRNNEISLVAFARLVSSVQGLPLS